MRLRPRFGFLLSLFAAIVQVGCGRDYHVTGRVVVSHVGESVIGEITGQPLPRAGKGLAGARVALFFSLNEDGLPKGPSRLKAATTDEQGFFDLTQFGPSGWENVVGIEVSANGYKTAYTTYRDLIDVHPQVFLVQLTPEA